MGEKNSLGGPISNAASVVHEETSSAEQAQTLAF